MREQIIAAIREIRLPPVPGEYDLHIAVAAILQAHGFEPLHEAKLAPRCRIDFLCGDIGIEIKKGRPVPSALRKQLSRYLECEMLSEIIVITERAVLLPDTLHGKRITQISLNRLWGIALP